MSAKVKLTCKTHPKYKAIREPKVNPDTFRVERTK